MWPAHEVKWNGKEHVISSQREYCFTLGMCSTNRVKVRGTEEAAEKLQMKPVVMVALRLYIIWWENWIRSLVLRISDMTTREAFRAAGSVWLQRAEKDGWNMEGLVRPGSFLQSCWKSWLMHIHCLQDQVESKSEWQREAKSPLEWQIESTEESQGNQACWHEHSRQMLIRRQVQRGRVLSCQGSF